MLKCASLAFLFLLTVGCGHPVTPPAPEARPVAIRVRPPQRVERPAYVAASGNVEAVLAVEAAFQVGGAVARVYVEEGWFVRKGQLLAELEPTDYRNAYQAATAQAEAARATAQKAEAGPRPQELEQARIDYERWADEHRRMKMLYERKSLPANDYRKVEAAYNAARQRYEMAREGTRREDVGAAQAAMRAAAAQADEARKRLADTRLNAPISGFIALRRVDPGETAGAGMPVFSIVDLNPVRVRAGIPEAEIGKVRQGAPATVIIPSLDNREFRGRVELIGVAAEPTSRTYPVRIVVPNPAHVLRAGMVAEARIEGAATVHALTVPGDAIVRDPQGATLVYVYFPDRQRVYARRVTAGGPIGTELEIRAGLSGTEQVVVAGQQKVNEGSRVEAAGVRP